MNVHHLLGLLGDFAASSLVSGDDQEEPEESGGHMGVVDLSGAFWQWMMASLGKREHATVNFIRHSGGIDSKHEAGNMTQEPPDVAFPLALSGTAPEKEAQGALPISTDHRYHQSLELPVSQSVAPSSSVHPAVALDEDPMAPAAPAASATGATVATSATPDQMPVSISLAEDDKSESGSAEAPPIILRHRPKFVEAAPPFAMDSHNPSSSAPVSAASFPLAAENPNLSPGDTTPVGEHERVTLEPFSSAEAEPHLVIEDSSLPEVFFHRQAMDRIGLRITDRELGPVWVDLSQRNGLVDIGIRATEAGTIDLIDTNLDQLLAGLRQRRVDVGQTEVIHWQFSPGSGEGDPRHRSWWSRQQWYSSRAGMGSVKEVDPLPASPPFTIQGDGTSRLNVMA